MAFGRPLRRLECHWRLLELPARRRCSLLQQARKRSTAINSISVETSEWRLR
jgi:hypothetical protein